MALCIEPTLSHRELGATFVASIPVYTLTTDSEQPDNPESKVKATLTCNVTGGSLAGSVADGSIAGSAVVASLYAPVMTASLAKASEFIATLSSPQHPQASLTAKAPAEGSLTLSQLAEPVLTGSAVDGYLAVSCPIDYITSCYSLGGWDDDLGWDDAKGWKN